MSTQKAALKLDQIFPGALPGPVIREEEVTPKTIPALSPVLQEACGIAAQEGVAVKLVTCRLQGMPTRADGSHEVRLIVPRTRKLNVAGTTI